jgi:outer membrane biosynthesis protein TonB
MIDSSDRLRISLRFAIPTIWVALALSLIFHAMVLWGWHPVEHEVTFDKVGPGKAGGPLVVQIAPEPSRATGPPPAPPSAPSAPAAEAPPARKTPVAKPTPRPPPPPPPVLAQEKPAPVVVPTPKPVPPPPAPAVTPDPGDFSALLEARRRARGAPPEESAPPTETPDERERHNQAVAANLGLNRTPTFGRDLTGGGVFQLQRLGVDSAEFLFYGWNRDIRRNATQRIEVSKGDSPNIQLAVVRRMIGIIRDHESGDFTWVSRRLGRDVVLSARMKDNAGLEDFMMQEFFFDNRLQR